MLPLIQAELGIPIVPKVEGWSEKIKKPKFSKQNWFNGNYQKTQDEYIKQNVGYKRFFVRFYNQFYYSFFNEAKANSVIIGKQNYLYETPYIDAYLGKSYVGKNAIRSKVEKLKKISDTLKTKGIDIIVILAPGKASFYPEYIPERFQKEKRTTNNYEAYKEQLNKSDVLLLDFHNWFRQMKDSSPHPLFPKTGIHWSSYGEVLVADSLVKYIDALNPLQSMPSFSIKSINTSSKMKHRDDDIEKGMNLLFDIPDLVMAYPKYHLEKSTKEKNTKVLSIADSYYWGLYNLGLSKHTFGNGQFWFYNKKIYPKPEEGPQLVSELNLVETVEKNDVIILMSTDATLHRFAFGFIDQLYELYYNQNE